MELDFLKDIENDLRNTEIKDVLGKFINEINNFIEKDNLLNVAEKYSKYWNVQNFMEDNVAASIGISKWSTNVRYRKELSKAVDDGILKLSESEGALYRKQFMANGTQNNPTYNIDKFENGKIEHLVLTKDQVPEGFEKEDIIFQYRHDGSIKVRNDLKGEAVKLASKSLEHLKAKENEKSAEYKREGHIYQARESDGYIFLKDLTESRGYVLEDIDFIVNCYQGEGKYQVIDGEYKLVNLEEKSF